MIAAKKADQLTLVNCQESGLERDQVSAPALVLAFTHCHRPRLFAITFMTAIDTSRRAFLRGEARIADAGTRMPFAVAAFADQCRRCDDCIKVCEEGILVQGDGGFPSVDFARGGCTFCGDCARACTHQALDTAVAPAWSLIAVVAEDCVARNGVTCRSCGEVCEARAVRFALRVGGPAVPAIDAAQCTGCGFCVAVCPTQSIQMREAA